jgi:hypothetical protein
MVPGGDVELPTFAILVVGRISHYASLVIDVILKKPAMAWLLSPVSVIVQSDRYSLIHRFPLPFLSAAVLQRFLREQPVPFCACGVEPWCGDGVSASPPALVALQQVLP